jgi:hypothetical protein
MGLQLVDSYYIIDKTTQLKGNHMTYRELIERLKELDEYQLDMDITVEDGGSDECFPARFLITDHESLLENSLEDGHPVFLIIGSYI